MDPLSPHVVRKTIWGRVSGSDFVSFGSPKIRRSILQTRQVSSSLIGQSICLNPLSIDHWQSAHEPEKGRIQRTEGNTPTQPLLVYIARRSVNLGCRNTPIARRCSLFFEALPFDQQ